MRSRWRAPAPDHCVSVVFVRGGRNLGSSNFFTRGGLGGEAEVLAAFLGQHYLAREAPAEILVSQAVEDSDLLEAALGERSGHAVRVRAGVRGTRARWVAMARANAELGLTMKAASRAGVAEQLESLGNVLGLGRAPARIECFDVSHTMGESAIASCVVMGPEGPIKSAYRRFNLRGLTPGDDYAGMRQAVERHFSRIARDEFPTAGRAADRRRAWPARGGTRRTEGSGSRAVDSRSEWPRGRIAARGRSAFSWTGRMRRLYSMQARRPCD